MDRCFRSLPGIQSYETSSKLIRILDIAWAGCTRDEYPGWIHTRTSQHLARDVRYRKCDSYPPSDPKCDQCHRRNQPSIATGCIAHSWIYEITRGRWLIPFLPDTVKSNNGLFIVRTVKIQGGLKSRIEECRDNCAALMDKLSRRINVDTNTQVRQTGTFLLVWRFLSPIHSWWA